jgi:DHA2 family multidrug resistance protein
MSNYTLQVNDWDIVWPGFIQGMGIGFTSVPLTTMTFSTLDRGLRPEGTAIYSLSRNIGSSIGISVMQTLLVHNTARMHATLAAYVTAGAVLLDHSGLTRLFDPRTTAGLAGLNQMVTRQAEFIGYIDDFRLMFWMTLLSMPCLLLMRESKRNADKPQDPAEAIAAAAE